MKKLSLIVALTAFFCIGNSFTYAVAAKTTAKRQSTVQPFCKFTVVNHQGHSTRLSTSTMHASNKNITFIFESGEKLVFNFSSVRVGHFIAESPRSKDPQIIFYPSHTGRAHGLVGAVMITSTKPLSGNFSHLISDDDEHLTIVGGSFTF